MNIIHNIIPNNTISHITNIRYIFNKYPDINYNIYADDIELHSNIESSDQLQ